MRTRLQVLSDAEKSEVHERTLGVLARTGMRVDTAEGRRVLAEAGASVDEATRIVRFPDKKFTVIILTNRNEARIAEFPHRIADWCLFPGD